MKHIYIEDIRPDNEGSLAEVPRLRAFMDIVAHFAPLKIDQSQGWDATPVGEACWRVVGFHVTWPQVVLAPKVLDADGNYIPGKRVYWRYTGAPARLGGEHHPKYFGDQGLFAETKHEGNGAEFVINGDHWVAPDSAGPNTVWVAAEPDGPQYSDAVHGLGMRVNTDHLIVSPIFQYMVKREETEADEPGVPDEEGNVDETPETPTISSDYELIVVVGGQEVGRIPIQNIAPGDSYVAIVQRENESLLGYLPISPNAVSNDGLVLHPSSQNSTSVNV
ncbi:MAG: hypothetical protein KDJ65_08785 [Anaerolineae bacterium]|nr:hypothetical protein [Anaerolineae bacterium]